MKKRQISILALEPYYGGSHRFFVDGWREKSHHQIQILSLPPRKWKWRMRHAAFDFAEQIKALLASGKHFDLIFANSMLNLAELKGFLTNELSRLPCILYFHENQLTYPVKREDQRDLHFAFNHLSSAYAADEIWFNSDFNRQSFLVALHKLIQRMPDHPPRTALDHLNKYSRVIHPFIDPPKIERKKNDICHITWAARWEFDKQPDLFFAAIRELKNKQCRFKLHILGESFREQPDCFTKAREEFKNEIVTWGYQDTREDYWSVLMNSDLIISTANHEFFGISILEAIAAGAYPVLPKMLAYPEVLSLEKYPERKCFFYDPKKKNLSDLLYQLIRQFENNTLWPQTIPAKDLWQNYTVQYIVDKMDQLCEKHVLEKSQMNSNK